MGRPIWKLLALALGLVLGALAAAAGGDWVDGAVEVAEPVGGLWLDALRMTIVPLVVSLLVTGIASGAGAVRAGGVAARALVVFLALLWTSSVLGAVLLPLFWEAWPLPTASGDALRAALTGEEEVAQVPGILDFLRGVVPANPVAAAANDAILPLIVFASVFGFAMTRLPAEPRGRLTGLFQAIADTMLVVIGWVLWIAPAGIFALAFVVGARAGVGAAGALAHYVVLVTAVGTVIFLLAYVVGAVAGRVALSRFAREVAPAQAVAASTQSSLASLPPMLASAERLGVPARVRDIVLPLAVAVFRATGPAMNLAVVYYVALWFGVELGPTQIAAGIAVAATTTLGAVSLPGQVSFVTSIAPIAIAMGVPVAPLALLIAVEQIPDIMRTLGNVTMNVAVTRWVGRSRAGNVEAPARVEGLQEAAP